MLENLVERNENITFAKNINSNIICNMGDNIKRAIAYLSKMCGSDMKYSKVTGNEIKVLPIAIASAYTWYNVHLLGIDIILAIPKDEETGTPAVLQKHGTIVTYKMSKHIVFVLSSIAPYNMTRLITARVNFIVPEKLIFIPSLLLELKTPVISKSLEDESMPPFAQCMILYQLQCGNLNAMTAYELADKFAVSYPGVSRALRWMETHGIIRQIGTKQKTMEFCNNGKELWDKTEPMMTSPVEKIMYSDNIPEDSLIAGENAMEKFTMLASPSFATVAISKQEAKENSGILDKEFGEHIVQVWKYNPHVLSNNGIIDKLSLYLALRNDEDERIQMELETMINEIQW